MVIDYSFFPPRLSFYLFLNLFLWLCWVFVAAHGLSLTVVGEGFSLWGSSVAEHRCQGARASAVCEWAQ